MHPVRLLILAVLFYILYRVIFGGEKKDAVKTEKIAANEDLLLEDPVCHTYVPQSSAIKLEKNGKTYYFCSQKCCDAFKKEQQ
jgi:YHS domain-containing protein